MTTLSPNSLERSSLEEMLESLRRKDDTEKPKDKPPELPARPRATSRARLPSTKRPLPGSFAIGESDGSFTSQAKRVEFKGLKGNSFGAKKMKEMKPEESPYVIPSEDKKFQVRLEDRDEAKLANSPSGNLPRFRESDWDDNLGYFIKKKLHVWCCPRNALWESGQIQSTSGEKASVQLSNGSVITVSTRELLPANPPILEGVDDLIQLSFLNEPSVLHNLQYRYLQDMIYSKAGPVLVAVNPFKDVQLYGSDFIAAYRQKLLDSPHVYSISDIAYNEMMTDQRNQSIIISGESGSGKTETAKFAMQYLAELGGGTGGIENEVLRTSCILEAFGNAKTSRNDNSSRFGKLIELYFSSSGKMYGAKIQTFLLEKSRVVQLVNGERSYHIFYQLCAGAPPDLRGRLKLSRSCDYRYLNQSDCLDIHEIDESQKFKTLMGALDTVNICKEDQIHAFEMLAAVLWLGNVSFRVIDNENHVEVVFDDAVKNASDLMGCDVQELMQALSSRKIQAGKEMVSKRLTMQQAIDTRDALSKFIYSSLFDWLVDKINLSLSRGKQLSGRSITVLDIYGFESFKKNGFEQLCINYANERLQQHFNRHLFKLEQEEYESDGIDWTKVDFEDNQECLDLFEKKPVGLLSLLDEESNFPNATDLTFAAKLKQHLNANQSFKSERGTTFGIRHYAGEVLYNTGEFLEKNRDPLHSEIIHLLSSCTTRLPHLFASTLLKQTQRPPNSTNHLGILPCQKQSVMTKFKGQLFTLMQQLESTTPHFIRCITPNTKKLPGMFENSTVLEQLRCCGVLEVVRISRSGYPTRMTHLEFSRRYGFLLSDNNPCQDPLSTSISVLQQFAILPNMYQVGYTKLYFRTGQIGVLEDLRKQVLLGTVEVQKQFRAHRARRHFYELKSVVLTLQSYVRGEIARKEYSALLGFRKQMAHSELPERLVAIVQIQSVVRGWLARRWFDRLNGSKHPKSVKWRPGKSNPEVKRRHEKHTPSIVEELQKRISMAEVTIGQKEKENASLREQVKQFEARSVEYEIKMKSVEEMWQRQIASLQTSLAAAKNCLGSDNPTTQASPRFNENGMEVIKVSDINGNYFLPSLVNEFENRKQNFDDEASAIIEIKPGHSSSMSPLEELHRLKHKFNSWRKDYKVRLREAKAKLYRSGQTETDTHRRKWWGKKGIRF